MECVFIYLFLFFATNLLPIANGGKNEYIQASLKARKYEDRTNPKELQDIVIESLGNHMKGRKFIAVSKTNYKLIKYWRGLRKNIWNQVIKVVSPSLAREAKTGRALLDKVYENYKMEKKSGKGSKGKKHDELSKEMDDNEDDDDYDSKPSRKKNGKGKKGRKHEDSSEEDSSIEDYSDEKIKHTNSIKKPLAKTMHPTKVKSPNESAKEKPKV